MKYAIIQTGGKQYQVSENSTLLIDKINALKDSLWEIPEVLFVRDEDKILIGTPYIKEIKVTARVIGEEKGKKIYIGKYKAKVHYRRRIGFRSNLTKLQIEKIGDKITPKKAKTKSS